MASGYDLDLHWLEDPPDDLKCLICLCVARNPRQHPGEGDNDCGKIFCQGCIAEYQNEHSTCPNCRQSLTVFKDAKSTRTINALKVKCNDNSNSCNWTGELRDLWKHQEFCEHSLLFCPNQCKINNKMTMLPKSRLKHHLDNDCPKRQFMCPHCKLAGEYEERTTTHLENCPKIRVSCPNTECRSKIFRYNMPLHLRSCKFESVSCKYAAIGCKEKPSRRELKQHEDNAIQHLQMTTEKNLELTQEVSRLKTDLYTHTRLLNEIKKVDSRLLRSLNTIKVTNYHAHKTANEQFFSRPFYTSFCGYKMRLRVDPNGCDDGEGTHVSVFACLVKGEHDDTLTWPFTGAVTFELLNQIEDKNHLKKTTLFLRDFVASQRVFNDEITEGHGYTMFISHQGLTRDVMSKILYLKDDALVFRVSVKVPNRQWLDCTV